MTAIVIDTLAYANKLKEAGVPDKQAEAQAELQADMQREILSTLAHEKVETTNKMATKDDLNNMEIKFDTKIDKMALEFTGKFTLLYWMLGFLLTGVLAILMKLFH